VICGEGVCCRWTEPDLVIAVSRCAWSSITGCSRPTATRVSSETLSSLHTPAVMNRNTSLSPARTRSQQQQHNQQQQQLECGPMPNAMSALPNIGGALCSTPQTRWNLQGCLKLVNRSQPLVGRSSPYYHDVSKRYCCLTTFFPIVDAFLICEDITRQSCVMLPIWRFLAIFCFLYLQRAACSTFQTGILNSH